MKTRFLLFTLCILIVNFAFSQSDTTHTVVAQQGDGIYKILRDNGYEAKAYYHKFCEINRDKIMEEDQLRLGETYILPPLDSADIKIPTTQDTTSIVANDSAIITEIITPKPNLRIADSIKSDNLQGSVFYIIAGHGGPDPGACSTVDNVMITEDEYAYDIALRLAKDIEEQGGKIYMIIDDPDDGIRDERFLKIDYDEYYYPDFGISRDKNQRLIERADAVNTLFYQNKDAKYQRVIEIHLDSRNEDQNVDAFFYYCQGSTKGKQLGETIQKVFKQKYAKYQPNRGYTGSVTERNLLVIKRVIPPAVFMEIGNMQNAKDRKRILDYNNRQALANWITEGLIIDYNAHR